MRVFVLIGGDSPSLNALVAKQERGYDSPERQGLTHPGSADYLALRLPLPEPVDL